MLVLLLHHITSTAKHSYVLFRFWCIPKLKNVELQFLYDVAIKGILSKIFTANIFSPFQSLCAEIS